MRHCLPASDLRPSNTSRLLSTTSRVSRNEWMELLLREREREEQQMTIPTQLVMEESSRAASLCDKKQNSERSYRTRPVRNKIIVVMVLPSCRA